MQDRGRRPSTATIAAVERLLADARSPSRCEGAGRLAFLPGQYVNLRCRAASEHRSYSFSSPPGRPTLAFLIRDMPGGLMSSYLRAGRSPATPMTFTGPSGSFYLRDIKRPLLMLAGGTGLAPFLSMLGQLAEKGTRRPADPPGLRRDPRRRPGRASRRWTRSPARIPNFTFATCVADQASDHPRKGYVTDHLEAEQLNAGEVDVYLCGPPPMVDAVRGWLAGAGRDPGELPLREVRAERRRQPLKLRAES